MTTDTGLSRQPPERAAGGWRPRRPMLMAGALGAVAALGQAPAGLWPLTLLALAGLFLLLSGRSGLRELALLALVAGAGYFAVALFWIVEPFLVDPVRHGWMAPFVLPLMAFGLALFWAAGAGLGALLVPLGHRLRGLSIALGLSVAELARGHVFTGFPWALAGHVWIETPVAQAAAWIGASGLTAVTLCLCALPAALARQAGQGAAARIAAGLPGLAVMAVAVAGLWAAGTARLAAPDPEPAGGVVRLVQPNAPQHLKWDPDWLAFFFERQLALTAAAPALGAPAPDLVVWSETAVPFLLERPGTGLRRIAEAAGGRAVAFGVQRGEAGRFFNSLAVLDAAGEVTALYDKHHLVPFGEYVPFVDLLMQTPVAGFAGRQLLGYSPGTGPALIDFGDLGRALPLICYEAIFPRHLRGTERPDWILQITNDAWFGEIAGPWQHLAQARFRAIEQGLPLARAANTGVSAMIDARGRLVAHLALGRMGALDVALPGALAAPPPYGRFGDGPLALVLVVAMAVLGVSFRRRPGGRVDPTMRRQ